MNKFRTLRADEIECWISTVKKNGVSLLLYKDARCDMNILDETVGPTNWMRSHSRENANCTVSIWDDDKKIWVSKEDTGTESYTEKEKGLASDSFKRACFNWGIGRELYTAPFIWIPAGKCSLKPTGRCDNNGKDILTCYDRFRVSCIEYDNKNCISYLQIKKGNDVVFEMGQGDTQGPEKAVREETPGPDKAEQRKQYITEAMVNALRSKYKEAGVDEAKVCVIYKVEDISGLTINQHQNIITFFDDVRARCSV